MHTFKLVLHEFSEKAFFYFTVLLGQIMISLCLTTVPTSNSSSENATYQETSDEMSPITNQTSVSETNVSAKMEGTTAEMPQENLTISHSTSGNLHNS